MMIARNWTLQTEEGRGLGIREVFRRFLMMIATWKAKKKSLQVAIPLAPTGSQEAGIELEFRE